MRTKRRILLLGSRSAFTEIVLERLINAASGELHLALEGPRRTAVPPQGAPAAPGELAVSAPHPLASRAARFQVPVTEITRASDILALGPAPDVIVSACFSLRLPQAVLDWPRHGCLNVHPSLLPAFRGPSPIFWQLHEGPGSTGVTVHRMVEAVDAGPVVAREDRPLEPGTSASALNRLLAKAGARLLADALRAKDWGKIETTPQDESAASYFSWPDDDAFRLQPDWPATRAYGFMAGTREWGRPYEMNLDGHHLVLERVLDYDPAGRLNSAFSTDGDTITVAFSPGVVRAFGRVA
ncbi:MAG: formyltransferase family protein [Gammaproteobacteria bacterium]|nr:formyltransferase family protein [Gammaproteobacteria bacterium]